MKNFNLFPLIIYGLFSIPFVIAGVLGYFSWKTVSGSLKAQGVVVEFFNSGEGDLKTPIVAYQVEDKTYEIQGEAFVSYAAYSKGETVSVVYKPGYPGKGRINSFTELWFAPTCFAVAGLISVAFLINFVRRG